MSDALYGPLGGIAVLVIGWALQQWTKRVERKADEKEKERKEKEAREVARADIADKVSEVWDRTASRLDRDLLAMEQKCDSCRIQLEKANDRLNRRDIATYALLEVLEELSPKWQLNADDSQHLHLAIVTMRESMWKN